MLRTKVLLLLILAAISFAWINSARSTSNSVSSTGSRKAAVVSVSSPSTKKLQEKATIAAAYAETNGYNTSTCFLVDMSMPSGQNRFFVYDLKKDSVQKSGLVTHGRCNEDWLESRRYGNTVGCGCTSLGKYKIGYKYQGRFGLAYKLYGLEKTNDKAFARYVVLHSHSCVPEKTVEDEICQSDGCPTVSPAFLESLAGIINASKKPVLLWIYN